MAGETIISITGNLVADPEIRYTQNGDAVANFTVASTPRTFDKQAGEWKDGEALFMRCTAWKEQAENIAESLVKGTRVFVRGPLTQRSWDDKKTGEKRTGYEMRAEDCGPCLARATAVVTKNPPKGQRYTASNPAPQGYAEAPPRQGDYPPPTNWGANPADGEAPF